MVINQFRTYEKNRTMSVLYVNGEPWEDVILEDPGRPQGVKIPGETCIPEGIYEVQITYSPMFKKPMMVLFNHRADHSIRRDDIFFNGIRVHAGTTIADTAGCLLLKSYDQLQALVKQELATGNPVYWVINKNL